jgi:HEPN domain-containing protein
MLYFIHESSKITGMLSAQKKKQLIHYWVVNAQKKEEAMMSLYSSKKYPEALFFGHLMLECICKALVVKHTNDHAPKIHNLVRLAELAQLPISLEDKKFLAQVNEFNMATRYPDEKFRFYTQCNKKFTDQYLTKIQEFYKLLCQKIKQK